MQRADKPILKRIKAVKSWLEKAEKSYTDNAETKGELQLLLAQAEMQRLEEKHRTLSLRRYPKTLMVAALTCVMIMIGTWISQSERSHSVTEAANSIKNEQGVIEASKSDSKPTLTRSTGETKTEESAVDAKTSTNSEGAKAVTAESLVVNTQVKEESVAPAKMITEEKPQETKSTHETNVVSSKEIQQAIRDGGRTLRGL